MGDEINGLPGRNGQQRNCARPASGWVYFIGGKKGPVKIGWATNPWRRLGHLQAGNPVDLTILAIMPGSEKDERRLHRQFEEVCVRGEWFARSDELNLLIADCQRQWTGEGRRIRAAERQRLLQHNEARKQRRWDVTAPEGDSSVVDAVAALQARWRAEKAA